MAQYLDEKGLAQVWSKIKAYIAEEGGVKALDVYPVGSIYMSVNNTSPAILFGGTWQAWGQGRVAVGVDSSQTEFNAGEKTGGNKTVTLTAAQMPSHTHIFTGKSGTTSSTSHTHSFSATSGSNGAHTHKIGNQILIYDTSWTSTLQHAGGNSNWKHVLSPSTESAGAHTHSVSGTSGSTSHTHTLTPAGANANTGSGGAHSNLQPFISCYMWKRVS